MLKNTTRCRTTTGKPPARWDNAHPNIVPYQVFKISDGWVIVACGNDSQFRKLVEVGYELALADDPRFASSLQRVRHLDLLVPLLEPMMLRKTRADWIAALEAAGVPCGPINDLAEVFEYPQVLAREMRLGLRHPTADQVRSAHRPARSGWGKHRWNTVARRRYWVITRREVLRELAGLSDAELGGLHARGVT